MRPLVRAGWLVSSLIAAALAGSVLRLDFTGFVPFALLALIAGLSMARPRWGLALIAVLVPVVWYAAAQLWNVQVAWAEAAICAALAGLGIDAARDRDRVPAAVAGPAVVFGLIVASALAAALRVMEMREGPALWARLATQLTHLYLVDHSLVAIHTGLLLLEGLLVFAHAARLGTRAGTLRLVTATTAAGAALAAICTLTRLAQAAARGHSFAAALIDLAGRVRWNVTYEDFNAAGSCYALVLLATCGLAWTASGRRRTPWIVCAVLTATALWLTSSRVAMVAVPAAAAFSLLLPRALAGGRRTLSVTGIVVLVCAGLALLAAVLPERGQQQSSLLSADVRVGLLHTGMRMIRAYPAYGIGLGEFYPHSAQYSSPDLLAKFPAIAVHGENAHNNFMQIAAETGIAGGLAFAWTIAAALVVTARRATRAGDRLLQLVLAGLTAFVLTMAAGHPLLVPEAAFTFWLMLGAAAGAASAAPNPQPVRTRGRTSLLAAIAVAVIVATLPLRMEAAARDANLEHVAIGMPTLWQSAPDGTRYREADGDVTIYVPPGGFRFSVNPRGAAARVEIVIDDRVADIVQLLPDRWNEVVVAPRTVHSESRFRRMDLRTVGDAHPPLWITKTEPIDPH